MFEKIKISLIGIMFILISCLFISQASFAQPYSCLPTCDGNDMRFFVFAGSDLSSFIETRYAFGISSPSDSPAVEIGFFDGEDAVDQGGGFFVSDWDGTAPANLIATLYADPTGEGDQMIQIAQWSGDGSVGDNAGTRMTDGDWFNVTVDNAEAAISENGNYRYTLVVSASVADPGAINQFKLRTDGTMVILPLNEFAFHTMWFSFDDSFVAWPNLTDEDFLDPACFNDATFRYQCSMQDPDCCIGGGPYDGSYVFYVNVPEGEGTFNVWDGDFDFTSSIDVMDTCVNDGAALDTDDWNTPPGVPDFAQGTGAQPQGASPGDPQDDLCFLENQLTPSVTYDIITPLGDTYNNPNVSGNQEWELFNIGSVGLVDVPVPGEQPGGIWTMRVRGLDFQNLAGLRFDHPVLAVNESGEPVPFDPIPEPDLVRDVPTMSEWGMLLVAALLGIVGFLTIRKRRVVA